VVALDSGGVEDNTVDDDDDASAAAAVDETFEVVVLFGDFVFAPLTAAAALVPAAVPAGFV
jgi:hypothetical protein